MKQSTKTKILNFAECFDSLRIVPRALLFGYCVWVVYVVDKILVWYMAIPSAQEKTIGDSGVIVGIVTAVTGMGGFVFKVYSENGRQWQNTSTVTATSTVTQP